MGGLCHVPHGQAMMVLLPHCIDYNIAHGINRGLYGELLLSVDETLYEATEPSRRDEVFAQLIHTYNTRFNEQYGVPIALHEVGVGRDQLDAVAQQARYDGSALYNKVEISVEMAKDILEAAY